MHMIKSALLNFTALARRLSSRVSASHPLSHAVWKSEAKFALQVLQIPARSSSYLFISTLILDARAYFCNVLLVSIMNEVLLCFSAETRRTPWSRGVFVCVCVSCSQHQ